MRGSWNKFRTCESLIRINLGILTGFFIYAKYFKSEVLEEKNFT